MSERSATPSSNPPSKWSTSYTSGASRDIQACLADTIISIVEVYYVIAKTVLFQGKCWWSSITLLVGSTMKDIGREEQGVAIAEFNRGKRGAIVPNRTEVTTFMRFLM